MFLTVFMFFVALSLSAVAAFYSIVGLVAIFAAAAIPVIVMASVLEVAKITTTLWLHEYWSQTRVIMRAYLVSAIVILMFITSLGIFGFLSKAHLEQAIAQGDNSLMVAEIDRQIEVERQTIANAASVIVQLDGAVETLIEFNRISGPNGAVAVRQSQQEERDMLNNIISESNRRISDLQQDRIPLVQEQLQIDAKVGPLKYVAAVIYGDSVDENLLEKTVRGVILLIVFVFDPLAIMMLLAATESLKWERQKRNKHVNLFGKPTEPEIAKEPTVEEQIQNIADAKDEEIAAALDKVYDETLIVPVDEQQIERIKELVKDVEVDLDKPLEDDQQPHTEQKPRFAEFVDDRKQQEEKLKNVDMSRIAEGYVQYEGKLYSATAFHEMFPEVDALGDVRKISGFGTQFPKNPVPNQLFLRVDYLPTRLFQWNGSNWNLINKQDIGKYEYDDAYIDHLIDQIAGGNYDPALLSEVEKQQIEKKLNQDAEKDK